MSKENILDPEGNNGRMRPERKHLVEITFNNKFNPVQEIHVNILN
jgi:hypothetical protein